jgi:heme/copper-type cytochrome/quinol oxidase subunit 1
MTRAFLQGLILFFLPFVLFGAYLVILRRNALAWSSWSSQSFWLAIAGLVMVILSLVATGLLTERETGAFVPTHIENGRVVPGQFQ